MPIDRQKLRGVYARLKGVQRSDCRGMLVGTIGRDFNKLATQTGEILGEPTNDFEVPAGAFSQNERREYCNGDEVANKLHQLVSYLEYTQHVGSEIIEIGSIYNSIQDEQLKALCADLLSAPGNFDRVINQATLVLEDRIRTKSGSRNGAIGVALVNEVIKADPNKSVLKISDDKNEQEGYASILRGVVGAYRNPTHHQLLDHITREDALKVRAFIDGLLKIVDGAEIGASS